MDRKLEIKTGGKPIVYVRPVKSVDLPGPIRAQIGDLAEVYALLDENGHYVALARDRALAFNLARVKEMEPMSVH